MLAWPTAEVYYSAEDIINSSKFYKPGIATYPGYIDSSFSRDMPIPPRGCGSPITVSRSVIQI